jgi:tRNA (guanine-N7-)-methyltransferase
MTHDMVSNENDAGLTKRRFSSQDSDKPVHFRDRDRFRTFGRAKGRPLSPAQTVMMEESFPSLRWDVENGIEVLHNLTPITPIRLEIGFGGAEHLLHQARNNPDVHFLGAEPFLNGVVKAVQGCVDEGLLNISLHHGDVRDVLKALPDACLDKVFVLFPDPWRKTRHHKRRLINPEFLGDIHRVLKPGHEFRFASDIIHYVDWTITRTHRHGGFAWPANNMGDWRTPPQDWCPTRYEAKAKREGRECHYFTFIRR